MKRFASIALAGVIVAATSCSGQQLVEVAGKVTLDGKPLENGNISFQPVDGKTATAEEIIVAGSYKAEVPPGRKRVIIQALKKVGEKPAYDNDPDSQMLDVIEPIPIKETDFTCEIRSGGGPYDFAVTTAQ